MLSAEPEITMTLPEAEEQYQQTLQANPYQPAVWCALGDTRLRLEKLPEAVAAYQNALRLEPTRSEVHLGLASVYKEQGKRNEAISHYHQALERVPDQPGALLNLGVLLAEQGQLEEAIGFWQRLLRLRPDHAQAHHNLGVAQAQQGQFEEAVLSLERALALKPDYPEACCNLANVLCSQKTGNKSQESGNRSQGSGVEGREQNRPTDRRLVAVGLLQRALTIRPDYIEAYHNLGAALIDLRRPDEAAVWLRQAVRLSEDWPQKTQKDTRTGPHRLQLPSHSQLLFDFSSAVKAFLDDLAAARLADRVSVLAFSEFGRTVRENGIKGTDHGTAGPVFLAGPPVRAGLVGETPSLTDLHPEHGDLKVGIDFRRVYASVLEDWLGLPSETALAGRFARLPLFRA
jgi:tetratricopeptide (TPR) repeat protein